MPENRPERTGTQRGAYEKNRRKIYATQTVCGICGRPVDFSLKFPDPLSPCIDHIVPVAKGGHPSDLGNLQLAHLCCNNQKSDKIFNSNKKTEPKIIGNRNLPQTMDWTAYNPGK